jgi:hypothetical protein
MLSLAGQKEHCSTHNCTQWQQFLTLDGYLHTLILSRVLVTIDGVWIGEYVYWYLIHSLCNYRQLQHYRYFHTLQFTVTQALRFTVFTSRILATDLEQSHCNFKSHMNSSFHRLIPFLPLYCNCQFRTLDSVQFLCSPAHIMADWRLETRLYLYCSCQLRNFTL